MNQFDRLPPDVIVYMAMNMDLPEILTFCMSSRRFNHIVCKNNKFWLQRLINDYDVHVDQIPRHYTPKTYYEYLVNNLPRFFIPSRDQRCEETMYLEEIEHNDFIVAYGNPDGYICYKLDELVDLISIPELVRPIDDRSLEILKMILQDRMNNKMNNKMRKLVVGFIDKELESRNINVTRLKELIDSTNKYQIIEALEAVLEAAEHDIEDRVGLSQRYIRAFALLSNLDREITNSLYADQESTVTILGVINQVLKGTFCLNEAKRKLTKSAKHYLMVIRSNKKFDL